MDQALVTAVAKTIEKQLDSEIDRLDNLTVDDIDIIREKRLKEMKERQDKIIHWKNIVRRRIIHLIINYKVNSIFRATENTQNWLTRKNSLTSARNRRIWWCTFIVIQLSDVELSTNI